MDVAVQEPASPDDDTLLFELQVFLCLVRGIKYNITSYSRTAPQRMGLKIPSPHREDVNPLRKKSICSHT